MLQHSRVQTAARGQVAKGGLGQAKGTELASFGYAKGPFPEDGGSLRLVLFFNVRLEHLRGQDDIVCVCASSTKLKVIINNIAILTIYPYLDVQFTMAIYWVV